MKNSTPNFVSKFNVILFSLVVLFVISITAAFAQKKDDDFNVGNTLSGWNLINVTEGWNATHLITTDVNSLQASKLVMKPSTSVWYDDRMGPYIFQNTNSDFVFTTIVNIAGNVGATPAANSHYSLGGILIRKPKTLTNGAAGWTAGNENWISIMVGYGDPTGPCNPGAGTHIGVTSTVNGLSNICLTPTTATTIELRVAKIGASVILLTRIPGGNWTIVHRETRADFTQDLQVGFAAQTDWDNATTYSAAFANAHDLNSNLSPDPSSSWSLAFHPDLTIGFEYGKWNSATVPSALTGVDLVNTASESDLLSFLSFEVSSGNTGGSGNGGGAGNGTGVEEIATKGSFWLTQQVVSGQIQINSDKTALSTPTAIYNTFGQQVANFTLTANNSNIDVNALSNGVYFVKVGTTTLKFIKQ